MAEVYSEQRARALRITLRVVQALAVVMAVVAGYVLVRTVTSPDPETHDTLVLYALVLVLQAGVLGLVSHWALRRIPGRGRQARLWCLITACLTLFASLPLLATSLLGIVLVFVGLFLLTLAWPTDRV